MALKHKSGETAVEAKKRRLVGFAKTDEGVEANKCIKIFFVSSPDEVGTSDGFCVEPMDLNQFFGEDGKIYGYKDLQINIWLSSLSFHAYADISYASKVDGGKGITDLKLDFENIFGESLLDKNDFLRTFSTESHCLRNTISAGTVLQCHSFNEEADSSDTHSHGSSIEHQVVRMELNSMPVGLLYSRLVPLTFLLIDGSSPIDVTDSKWDIYFTVKKIQSNTGEYDLTLLGFATVYRFYHHPGSTRLRLSQILVLPPYQGKGHGRRLLESVNSTAITENVYDLTVEEPSEYLQYLRSCIDTLRLFDFEPIKPAINSIASSLSTESVSNSALKSLAGPPTHAVEIVRQKLKINKTQFLKCWDVLIYLMLDNKNRIIMENFRAVILARVRSDIFDKDAESKGKHLVEVPNDYDHDMTFVVYCPHEGGESESLERRLDSDQADQEQQLNKLVDKKLEEIVEIAEKVCSLSK
ncbi:probable histone acetyltransferase type B catalytic subunit isoform X2 [Phalaenopsis equestris]|nr:probable histone acetyltransferase type B catalytic subunit isoform X2 [Phalaenopsis equestris]